jgi:catechol 2,3-dioxygenase-like lactoylglutathione lyase family enzyme
MFKRLMYITLFASNQERAFDFYSTAFGFEKRADYSGPEGRFLTMALENGPEVLPWPGSPGRATPTGSPGDRRARHAHHRIGRSREGLRMASFPWRPV